MFGIGTTEICVVAFVLIILFGGAKVKSWGGDLGYSIREFKNAFKDVEDVEKDLKS